MAHVCASAAEFCQEFGNDYEGSLSGEELIFEEEEEEEAEDVEEEDEEVDPDELADFEETNQAMAIKTHESRDCQKLCFLISTGMHQRNPQLDGLEGPGGTALLGLSGVSHFDFGRSCSHNA